MKKFLIGILLLIIAGCAAVGSSSFKRGEDLSAAGDLDNAVIAYADAVEKSPDRAEYRMRLSLIRHKAAIAHKLKGDELLSRQDFRGALREYQISSSLDGSGESSQDGAREAQRYIEAEKKTLEAGALLRDRHYKQARKLNDETLAILPDYPPAQALRVELDKRSSVIIDGVELEVTSDEPITLNFKATNLPDVFDILTQLSGIRFILDDSIRTQTATLYLEGATFAQAFELLLRMNKLDKKILNAKTIILFPNSNDKQKQFADQIIQTFYLSNIDAKKAVNLLRTMLQVRKIYVHEELNAVVLRDTPQVIRLAQQILEANDRSDSEVVFDLELVEVSHSNKLEIGPALSSYQMSVGVSGNPLSTSSSEAITSVVVGDFNNLKPLFSIPSATFDFLKSNGDAEILASPKIRVKNKGKAKVHIGTREPIVTVTTTGTDQVSENIQYVDVGVKLDVEPIIQLDNTIVAKLGLEVSNATRDPKGTAGGSTLLTISTTNANTELILKDGERSIIGGLLRDSESKTKTGIPILSDIPLLGAFFTSYKKDHTKREILLSITPHIVRAINLPTSDVASIWSGGEDDLRVGRNFGSFAEEYIEGQGKTQPSVVPANQNLKEQSLMHNPAEAIAEALIDQQEPEAAKLLEEVQPRVPVPPAVSDKVPTVEAVKPAAPQAEQSPPARNVAPSAVRPTAPEKPAESTRLVPPATVPGASSEVPEVVLPGVQIPEAIIRPVVFVEGDRLAGVGNNFTVSLSVQDVKNLFSAPLYVRFDPKLVDFVSAEEGSFLKQAGGQTIFTSTLMVDSGRVIMGLKQGAGGSGATGGGILARLTFKAKTPGKLAITPERVNFRNPGGERLLIDSRGLIVEVK